MSHSQKRNKFCLVLWVIFQRTFHKKRWIRYLRHRKWFNTLVEKKFNERIEQLQFEINRKAMKDTRIIIPNSGYGRKNTWT